MSAGAVVNEPGTDWTPICRFADILPERGVAALVADHQVAVFRTFDDMLHAVDNRDPYSGAYVLSRGIVGTRGDVPTVASPLYKQVFDLRTGRCVTDESTAVNVHEVRRAGEMVEVRLRTVDEVRLRTVDEVRVRVHTT